MKEYRKNKSNNVLNNIKENNKLKFVEVVVVTNFIKDEVESFFDIDNVFVDDDDDIDADDDEQYNIIGFR